MYNIQRGNKRVLVIHPQDSSTNFLRGVYKNLDNINLITGGVSRLMLREMIKTHDQVMMMGHGSDRGLMGMGQFPGSHFWVIDDTFKDILSEKKNSVFIWCNADGYVDYNQLRGFYTGMFISEIAEARMMQVQADQHQVDKSNHFFCESVSRMASKSHWSMWAAAKRFYGELAKINPVAQYNHQRLYVS